MKILPSVKKLSGVIILTWVLLFGLTSASYAADPPPNQAAAYQKLLSEAGTTPDITWDDHTGVPTFIRGSFPAEIGLQGQAAGGPELAYRFFNRYGDLFRMQNPAAELVTLNSREENGQTHTRLQQLYQGVPVWGAQLLAHSQNGQITAVNGHYQPDINLDPTPLLSADQVEAIARRELGDTQASRLKAVELVVMTYHTAPTLTWLVELFSENPPGRWRYFVNAHTGEITYHYNALTSARDRWIYNAGGACHDSSLPGTWMANESTGGSLPSGAAGDAFIYMGNTYNYFFSTFGRDSFDAWGSTIITSVQFGAYGVCTPYAWNAFWDGRKFVFGSGGGGVNYFSGAQDVVAHEFTHAVTEHTAGMIYQFEQGALNESISDIFGSFEQQYATGDVSNWTMGEDLGSSMFFRDMSNPPWYGQPDHMNNYREYGLYDDNGGVHINSGIPNKAAYLMTAGGNFSGLTISGLGRAKTQQIFYQALYFYLSPLSGFQDASVSTVFACTNLIGSYGITAADCDQVQNAWVAVGVGQPVSPVVLPPLPLQIYLPLISRGANLIYEPNDDKRQAYGPLLSGVNYQAYIQTNGDVDIYYFATSGGNISISLSNLAADYELELYESDGDLVDYSHNNGTTSESISGSFYSGIYYIYIYPFYSASSGSAPYNLRATYP